MHRAWSGVHHIRGSELTYLRCHQRISLITRELKESHADSLFFISPPRSPKTPHPTPLSILHIRGEILT